MRSVVAKALALAALGLLIATSGAAAQTLKAIALPPLSEGDDCEATDINANGIIIGHCDDIPVRWDRHRSIERLEGDDCRARAINEKGEGAGFCRAGGNLAVVWGRDGKISERLPPGSDDEFAYDINSRGEVLGRFSDLGYGVFDLKTGDVRKLLDLDDDSFLRVRAINYRGQVAGSTIVDEAGGPSTAVVWGKNGVPRRLLPLDGWPESAAYDINNKGQVVGASGGIEGLYAPLATFWEKDGTPRLLSPLPGHNTCEANGMNRQGEAVGFSFYDGEPGLSAVLWDRSGTPIELPVLPDTANAWANAISDRGEIVGRSENNEGHTTAVLWR